MAYKIKNKQKVTLKGNSYITNPRLMDAEGEYSANPSDYFQMDKKDKFKELNLVVDEFKDGWKRSIVLKKEPTKEDLIKVNKKTKTFI